MKWTGPNGKFEWHCLGGEEISKGRRKRVKFVEKEVERGDIFEKVEKKSGSF